MSDYSPAMDASLSSDGATIFYAVRIALPGGDLLLVDGSTDITFGSLTFVGEDPTYGSLSSIDGLEDGADAQVSEITINLKPPSMAAAGALASPDFQESSVQVWKGSLIAPTGQVVASPKLMFSGALDVPTASGDFGALNLTWTAVAETDRLFDADEGIRLSDAFLQLMYPGDLGCAFVTGVQDQQPWGQEARIPASVTSVNTIVNADLLRAMGGLRV